MPKQPAIRIAAAAVCTMLFGVVGSAALAGPKGVTVTTVAPVSTPVVAPVATTVLNPFSLTTVAVRGPVSVVAPVLVPVTPAAASGYAPTPPRGGTTTAPPGNPVPVLVIFGGGSPPPPPAPAY